MATGRCAVVQLGPAAKRYCWLNIVDYSRSPSTEKIRQTSRGNVRDFNTGNVLLARARTGWARSTLDFRATLFMRPRKLFANANFLTYCPIILVGLHVAKQVVKVIWHRAATPPNTDSFSRIRHVALMCDPITPICVLTVPVLLLLSHFEYIDRRTCRGPAVFRLHNCPFTCGNLDPIFRHGSLGPPESIFRTASRSVQPLLQGSRSWQTDRRR